MKLVAGLLVRISGRTLVFHNSAPDIGQYCFQPTFLFISGLSAGWAGLLKLPGKDSKLVEGHH